MKNTLGLQIEINKELNEMLMRTCDIRFYKELQQPQFSENGEVYSHKCQAFAHDGSGGEFVLLEDGSIGLISSEGSVGRVADRLDDLLAFLVNGANIFDFNYINLYKNKELLRTFCMAYLKKMRNEYAENRTDWDEIHGALAKKLSVSFTPENLPELAETFYQAATRIPTFICSYKDGEKDYTCDSVLSDIFPQWIGTLLQMTKEDFETLSHK